MPYMGTVPSSSKVQRWRGVASVSCSKVGSVGWEDSRHVLQHRVERSSSRVGKPRSGRPSAVWRAAFLGRAEAELVEEVLGVNRRGGCSGAVARPGARGVGDRVRLLVHVQALQAHRRAQQIAGGALQAVAVVGRHGHRGVHREFAVPLRQ